MSVTVPRPSQRGHMPPARVKVRLSVSGLSAPRSTVIAPLPRTERDVERERLGRPTCGRPSRLNTIRSIALASVAVPTVERELAPIRSWSTMIAVVSPSSRSTSGGPARHESLDECAVGLVDEPLRLGGDRAEHQRALAGPRDAGEDGQPRFGISTLTSLRLFSRAPWTRIRSWLSATCGAMACPSSWPGHLSMKGAISSGSHRRGGFSKTARSHRHPGREPRTHGQHLDAVRRHERPVPGGSRTASPTISLNVRLKVPRLVNPTSKQTSVTLRSVSRSRNIERSTRRRCR